MTRTMTRTAVLAAAAAALSLTLTACNGSDGTQDEGAAKNTASAASSSSASSTGGGTSDTASSGGTGGDSAQASSGGASQAGADKAGSSTGGSGTSAKTPECKVGFLTYKLERKNPEAQGDHLLITAENRSASACTVQKFPVVTPGAMNGDLPQSKKDTQPAQPITVQPGAKVYSAIAVFQNVKAEDGHFTSLRMSLQMNNPDDAETVTLQAPGDVAYDSTANDSLEVYSWNKAKPFDF
jgi:hypothetical protein